MLCKLKMAKEADLRYRVLVHTEPATIAARGVTHVCVTGTYAEACNVAVMTCQAMGCDAGLEVLLDGHWYTCGLFRRATWVQYDDGAPQMILDEEEKEEGDDGDYI